MRKTILTFTLGILTATFSFAQEKKVQNIEATFVTEMKIDYDKMMEQIPQQVRAQVGPMFKAEIDAGIFMNYFFKNNGKMSTYTLEQKVGNAQSQGGMLAQQIASFDNKPTYKDFSANPPMSYKEVDMMGKSFLIKDKVQDYKWKISREKTEIAGYQATKAEGVMMDSIPVTAWFAPAIPVKDGPTGLGGLPGFIVKAEFNMNNTDMIVTLKELNISDKDLKITLPTKGQVVTTEEFMKVVTDMQKKFQEMSNSGVDTK